MSSHFVLLAILAITCSVVLADIAPLQDFCVAERNSSVRVNGLTCKDPKLVDADDFFFSGLSIVANISNAYYKSQGTRAWVTQLPGLNTLGLSMTHMEFLPWGMNPPHTNPRASEIFTVIQGTIEVAFITSNPENKLITKVLQKGDVWVFPQGLIHYQRNVGNSNATATLVHNSQAPGIIYIASNVFGSYPFISNDLLAKAFQVDEKIIAELNK